MRILIIGGITKSLSNFRGDLIKKLVANGHEVLTAAGEEYIGCVEELANIGARFIPIPVSRASINPLADYMLYRFLQRLIRSIKVDIVLAYTIKPIIFGSFAARCGRVPRIISLITGLGYAFSDKGFKSKMVGVIAQILYKIALHMNDLVIFQNQDNAKLFFEKRLLGSDKAWAIVDGSGVDVERFSVVELPSKPSFLMISRLIRDKGVLEYAAAARLVKKTCPQAAFKLLGKLDHNPNSITQELLDSWITEGSLDHFNGMNDVRPAIRSCSIYVLPSYSEGLPRTVLEAMAMGRAIITTDAPGCRETIEQARAIRGDLPPGLKIGSNGILVPPRDSATLAFAMRFLAEQPDLVIRMGEESRRIAEKRFASEKINSEMMSLIIGDRSE